MSTSEDQELQALLADLAPTEEERALILEEHRLMEKDLFRLADPLPPPDFLANVMAKVEAAPQPVRLGAEVVTALAVVGVSLAFAAVAVASTASAGTGVGVWMAQLVLSVKDAAVGLGSALSVLWKTAAMPTVIVLSVMLGVTLPVLRRFAVQPARAARVSA